MPAAPARRIGRPPATTSAETRRRILDVARAAFAEQGWEVTTNKDIATKAGITAAALYHYFDSKLAMFLAVFDDVELFVDARFDEAMSASDTFVGQFQALLEAAYLMNKADPSLARFLGSARVDITRHRELRDAVEDHRRPGAALVEHLIATGIATGEVPAARRAQANAFVRTTLVGLNDAVSHDLREQRAAIDGIMAVVEGRLLERRPASRASSKASPGRAAVKGTTRRAR